MTASSERGYALLPHTADVIVSAWGPSAAACLDQAARGLSAVSAEVPDTAARRSVPYACGPDTDVELLVRVLEEVIYLAEVRELVVVGAVLDRTPQGGLAGHFDAMPLDAVVPVGPAPKAITRHGLAFGRDERGWQCTVTVDV